MSSIGSEDRILKPGQKGRSSGFTLLELMVAFSIAALLVGVTTPAAIKMYDSMQYRDTVRGVVGAAQKARLMALSEGVSVDMVIDTHARSLQTVKVSRQLPRDESLPFGRVLVFPDTLGMEAVTASDLAREGRNIIRFYPGGGSSGGSISILRAENIGIRVRVDWLTGLASQERLDVL
ncbi:pilus assembly FimT family protein [Marinobacterium marinum]|uniref:Prepilin-type N-terminal cleavage/methylation domain-containing protein n=1 Tax=Marinobacterium marinum TaxID=2756129 RepID=A0A7W1WVJ1_9GAMM|nr:prepilin-type N-terminal cleavage/methylation domain-containing protein [Marinobacterium marinum]MBA4501010.1 prepilin-type N-terminal cleavage/methylation domain-containing protein [Marinobacterium marinum]